jgi:hypothetical protein
VALFGAQAVTIDSAMRYFCRGRNEGFEAFLKWEASKPPSRSVGQSTKSLHSRVNQFPPITGATMRDVVSMSTTRPAAAAAATCAALVNGISAGMNVLVGRTSTRLHEPV